MNEANMISFLKYQSKMPCFDQAKNDGQVNLNSIPTLRLLSLFSLRDHLYCHVTLIVRLEYIASYAINTYLYISH